MVFVLISPAKTMRFDHLRPQIKGDVPHFQKRATQLSGILKKKSPAELKKLMGISDKLATLNALRFKEFSQLPKKENANLAILAYQGAVYQGLDAKSFSDSRIKSAQKYIGMLSGFYGLVRPLDLIQAYRLEMSIPLAVGTQKNLYGYWGDDITDHINALVKKYKHKAVIGCVSNEYLDAVDVKKLNVPFIQCVFKEKKGATYKIVALFAKKARGMMARYIVENEITDPKELKNFTSGQYVFNRALSSDTLFVFTR
jgi:cytoplasmic iron level regulating protein YaaA (DUF328/UPF0246 family)